VVARNEEFLVPEYELLMSTTDRTGRITHCNAAFTHVSGYAMDELMGQPHNIVRHPDMPREAFKDLWTTIGHGRAWSGVVKNLRKDGRYYWVRAYVTPIMEHGKPVGYMSVRVKPTDNEVRAASALYERLNNGTQGNAYLHAGSVRHHGLLNQLGKLQRASFTQRLATLLLPMVAVALLFPLMGWTQGWQTGLQAGVLALLAALTLYRQHVRVTRPFEDVALLAGDIAGCKLDGALPAYQGRHPMAFLLERLKQVHINLRAVVGDARHEIDGFTVMSRQLTQGSINLAQRTDRLGSFNEEDRRVVNVWADKGEITTATGFRLQPMRFVACEMAGARAAMPPHQGLSRHRVHSISRAPGMYARFRREHLNELGASGVWIITQDAPGGPVYVRHQVTAAREGGVLFYEDSAGANADLICFEIDDLIDPKIGKTNANRRTLVNLKAEMIDARIVNASISGETTSGGRARLPALLNQHKPQIVVIELGANDGLRGLPITDVRANFESLIQLSRGSGAKVLLVGMRIPPNYGPAYAGAFHALYGDLAKRHGLPLVPFFLDGIALDDSLMLEDGLHPNAAAQPKLLELVMDGQIDTTDLISHRLPLEEAATAYKNFHDNPNEWTKVVLQP
jgi:PAS domain S-box-containing protein